MKLLVNEAQCSPERGYFNSTLRLHIVLYIKQLMTSVIAFNLKYLGASLL